MQTTDGPSPLTKGDGVQSPFVIDGCEAQAAIQRLVWRCRRGLLELDLWMGGFLAASRATLQPDEVTAFERLLALSDMRIMDLLNGVCEADDTALQALLRRIHDYRIANRDLGNEQNSHPQL